jgi:hypothetical protein
MDLRENYIIMKRRSMYVFTAIAALLILTPASTPTVTAADYQAIGISAGDTAIYEYTLTTGAPYDQINRTATLFLGLNGANVTFMRSYNYLNGSYFSSDQYTENITTYVPSGRLWRRLIPANLNVDDPLQIGSPYKVNQTFSATFAGASRTIINASFLSSAVSCCKQYDRSTGILIRSILYLGSGDWENITLMSTTAWPPSAPAQGMFNTTTIIAIAGVGVVALAVGYLVGRSGKKKKK